MPRRQEIPGYSQYPSYVRSYVPLPIELIHGAAQETTRRYDVASEQLDTIRRALGTSVVSPTDQAAFDRRIGGINERIDTLSRDGILSDKHSQIRAIARDFETYYSRFQRNQAVQGAARTAIEDLEVSGARKQAFINAQFSGYEGLEREGQLTNFFNPRYQFSNEVNLLNDIALPAINALKSQTRPGPIGTAGGMMSTSSTEVLSESSIYNAVRMAFQSPEAQGNFANDAYLYRAENPDATNEEVAQYVEQRQDQMARNIARTYAYDNVNLDYRNLPDTDGDGSDGNEVSVRAGNLTYMSPAEIVPQPALSFGTISGRLSSDRSNLIGNFNNIRDRLRADEGWSIGFVDSRTGETTNRANIWDDNFDIQITNPRGEVDTNHQYYDLFNQVRTRAINFRRTFNAAAGSVLADLRRENPGVNLSLDDEGNLIQDSRPVSLGPTAQTSLPFPRSIGAGRPNILRQFQTRTETEFNRLSNLRQAASMELIAIPNTGPEGNANVSFMNNITGAEAFNASGDDGQGSSNGGLGAPYQRQQGETYVPVGFGQTERGSIVHATVNDVDGNPTNKHIILRGDSINMYVRQMLQNDPAALIWQTINDRFGTDLPGNEVVRLNSRDISAMGINNITDAASNVHQTQELRALRVTRRQSGVTLEATFRNDSNNFSVDGNTVEEVLRQAIPEVRSRSAFAAGIQMPTGGMSGLQGLLGAIAGQESGGFTNPAITNDSSGALGIGQVMPANIGPWTEEHLGRRMTPTEFAADPEAQVQVMQGQISKYVEQFREQAGDETTALRMAINAWYSGEGRAHLHNDDRPIWNRAGSSGVASHTRPPGEGWVQHPSRKDYVDQVLARLNSG